MRKNVPGRTETKNNRTSWSIPIVLILILVGFLFAMCYFEGTKPEPEDYFIKYEDATMLVEIEYGERSLVGYKKASGFINNDDYEKYKNNEYDETTITVHHPYLRGESIMVNTNSVVTITVKTYDSFYNSYPLDVYGK